MNADALTVAQSALKMRDLYLRSGAQGIADDLLGTIENHPSVILQHKHFVVRSEVLSEGDGESGPYIFRVIVEFGLRWIFRDKDKKKRRPSSLGGAAKDNELGRVEATYGVEYDLAEMIPQECLDAYALKNSSIHVWPYWREFLSSACARMNAPRIVLPVWQAAANANDSPESGASTIEKSSHPLRLGAPKRGQEDKRAGKGRSK